MIYLHNFNSFLLCPQVANLCVFYSLLQYWKSLECFIIYLFNTACYFRSPVSLFINFYRRLWMPPQLTMSIKSVGRDATHNYTISPLKNFKVMIKEYRILTKISQDIMMTINSYYAIKYNKIPRYLQNLGILSILLCYNRN